MSRHKIAESKDLLALFETALHSAATEVDLAAAMKRALIDNPVKVLEVLARLKAIGLLEKGVEELGDADLIQLVEKFMGDRKISKALKGVKSDTTGLDPK